MKKRIKVPKGWEDTPQSFENFERLARGLMTAPKTQTETRSGKATSEHEKHTEKRRNRNKDLR